MPTRLCPGPAPGQPCPTRQLVSAQRGSKTAARCGYCQSIWQHAKDQRRPERRTHAEQQRRRQAVTEWVNTHGWWCPGIPHEVEPHLSRDLTADHLHPPGLGHPEHGPLTVRCRSCNSKLGAAIRSS
jgi:5-methylcytosine-specific restriction enzyme A